MTEAGGRPAAAARGALLIAAACALLLFPLIVPRVDAVAVGILMAAMILAVGNVISGSVQGLTGALMDPKFELAYFADLVVGIVNLLIGIWVATTVVSLAIRALDKMTKDIDEMAEVAKGNVAVAVMVAGVLLAVSVVVSQGVQAISKILDVNNNVANLQQASTWIANKLEEGGETIIAALPLSHIFCLTANILTFMKYGGHNVLIPIPATCPVS